jgi:glucosylceramidase
MIDSIEFHKTGQAVAGKLTMYVSMESSCFYNGSMLQGGKLKREFYQSWANYYAKFIKAYEKEGIPYGE